MKVGFRKKKIIEKLITIQVVMLHLIDPVSAIVRFKFLYT